MEEKIKKLKDLQAENDAKFVLAVKIGDDPDTDPVKNKADCQAED